MFYVLFTLLYVHSRFAIIVMGKRELVFLLSLFSWCLMIFMRLFLAALWVCLQFVIVVFPRHIHYFLLFAFGIINSPGIVFSVLFDNWTIFWMLSRCW